MAAIRQATLDDADTIVLLAREFGELYSDFPVRDDVGCMIRGCIIDGVAYVSEIDGNINGAIVGMILDHPFLQCKVLAELGWYATGRTGAFLLSRFVDYGKQVGVDLITASTLNTSPPNAARLMELVGMQQREVVWQLKLGE